MSASDPLAGYSVEQLLDGRSRPGHADPEADRRWLKARHAILRIADEQFDPRQILGLSADAAADWRDSRLQWLKQHLDLRSETDQWE